MTIRVLICDDSPLMRRLLIKMLSTDATIQVVGEAENGEQCLSRILELGPDVVLLDLAMPVMDGIETLRKAKEQGLNPAFIVVSTKAVKDSQTTIDALTAGAVDFVTKAQGMLQMESIQPDVVAKVRLAHEARLRTISHVIKKGAVAAPESNGGAAESAAPAAAPPPPRPAEGRRTSLTILGGSAGCMQVLPSILAALPEKIAGCLVLILKLPPFLTKQIPKQFAGSCAIPIELAAAGVPLQAGRVYVAPGGDQNLTFERDPSGKRVVFKLATPDKAEEGAPSIDAAMASAAKLFRDGTRGILISGTGKDGLEGLRSILYVGGETVIQDRGSAIAPQLVIAAAEQSLAQKQLPALEIAALFKTL